MKRTFLVEIESDGHPALWNDEAIQYRIMMSPRDSVTVTETTATHAKERDVIEAALAEDAALEKSKDFKVSSRYAWSVAREKTQAKARELRTLMEKKA